MTEKITAWRVIWCAAEASPIDSDGLDFVTRMAAMTRALREAQQAGQPVQFSANAVGTRLRDGAEVVRIERVVVPPGARILGAHGQVVPPLPQVPPRARA